MHCVLRSDLLSGAGFAHGFSLRGGGVSRPPFDSLNLGRSVGDDAASVAENHLRLARQVGYAPERLFELSQVHGRQVRRVGVHELPEQVRREEGDALCTRERGLAVGVRAADCLPLLLADPETRAVAAVHAGWRGTVANVVPAAVQALIELTSAPAHRLLAAVFPHIRACCFEVGDEVALQLTASSDAAQVVRRDQLRPHVDLAAVVRAQLLALGISATCIDDVAGCTRCEPERFFSFRRDGQASGRHLGVIVAG
jgi:YfiH family protein